MIDERTNKKQTNVYIIQDYNKINILKKFNKITINSYAYIYK